MKSFLILEDGTVFTGTNLGANQEVISEIVFNTSMTGYLELMTDPSYAGQAVAFTYPLIGNYGVCKKDMESKRPWIDGLIIREMSRLPSNFRSQGSLPDFMEEYEITGIEGIDTRALTKILRKKGTMNGMITCKEDYDLEECLKRIRSYQVSGVVKRTSRKKTETYRPGDLDTDASINVGKNVAVLDVGMKKNIIRCLLGRGCQVKVYPATTKAETILKDAPDGIMITNGPGNPKECVDVIKEVGKLYESDVPIFAICLGHQLMALATGADTRKLKYGHRGSNHPVKDLKSTRVYISSQNHGYVVDEGSVDSNVAKIRFVNVNDNTVEGLEYVGKRIFTVQFHPEAHAGPKDSEGLINRFIRMMEM